MRLETELPVDAVTDGSDEPLEGRLRDQKLGGLLVSLDLSEGNCPGSPAHLLLHASLSRSSLLDGLLGLDGATTLDCAATSLADLASLAA